MTRMAKLALLHPLLTWCVMMGECQRETKKKDAKYIIIGAGIAGLTGARNLARYNEGDFLILEGHSRIGGRIRNEVVDGITLEVGCQWINSYGSPIGQLAGKVGLKWTDEIGDKLRYVSENGIDITEFAMKRYAQFQKCYDYVTTLANDLIYDAQKKPDIPLRSALSLAGWIPRDSVDYAIEFCDLNYEYGQEPEMTSLRHSPAAWFSNDSSYTEAIVIDQDGGLFKIVQRLHDDVMTADDPRLKLNHVVTDVRYTDEGVSVTTSDNKTYTADYVIITVSLGVLQHDVIKFHPPLPEWKRYSLMAATFVSQYPIYVIFPPEQPPFWNDSDVIVYVHRRRGFYTLWQNYDKLINGSRILQVQLSGFEGERIARLSDDEIKAEVTSVLSAMFNAAVPEVRLVVGRWDSDPLHYGTYAGWSPHFGQSSFDALSAVVGRLYFAGEAYHEQFYGYMEGAYWSAIEQTNRLLRCVADPSECQQYAPPDETRRCTGDPATNCDEQAPTDDGSCQFGTNSPPTGGSLAAWPNASGVLVIIVLALVF